MNKEAIDLLYESIEKHKDNFLSQPIGMYLINACGEENSDELCNAVLSENKKFSNCLNYIMNYAKKNAVKVGSMSCAAFADDVIYAKVIEYYMSDDIPEEDIKGLGGTTGSGAVQEKPKVAKSKISSSKQESLFDLGGGDEDEETNEESEEKLEQK